MAKITLETDENGCIEVAYNSCYGGFSISREALDRMVELGSVEAKIYLDKIKDLPYKVYSYDPEVPRFDPILIRVIKELKNKASGSFASLAICKVNIDDLIDIEEYDGKENVVGGGKEINYGRYDED